MSLPQSAPKRVGRYRLLAPIARGGAATVYLGRSEGIGGFERIVAVKLLHPHLLEDASSQAANEFLEEAKLSARMQHPMIVPVMDVGHSPEGFFLVMDYVDGASLSEITREDLRIPPDIAMRILSDALEGLEAAHQAKDEKGRSLGIVHRDFSPQNILVGTDGRSRLTDFGIARATTRAEYTRTGLVKGKVAYMSPEQAEGKSLDIRSDVWAAGVVAWEMFAGRRMYPQMDPMPMMLRIINERPPRLRKANSDAPEALDEAISQALEPDRKLRCSSAQEFRKLLVDAMGGPSAMATREKVGDFIVGLEIERLDELRAIIQEESRSLHVGVLGGSQDEIPTMTDRRASVQVESGTFATTSAEMPSAQTTAELERQLTGGRRRRTFGIFAAVVVAAATALFVFGGGEEPTPISGEGGTVPTKPSSPGNPSPDALPKNSPPTPARINAPETSEPEPSTAPRTEITLTANANFETVTVGTRAVVLPAPTRTATIHLREDEQTARLSLVAVTNDGRRAQATLGPTEESISVTFAEPKKLKRPRPPLPRRPAEKPSPSDLAASPY